MAQSTKFHYDQNKPTGPQVDAAIRATKQPLRLDRYWLETAFALALLLVVAAIFGSSWLRVGVVAARRINEGSVIQGEDLELVAMPSQPSFTTTSAVAGLTALNEIPPGQALRRETVGMTRAISTRTIFPGEVFDASAVDFKVGPYESDALGWTVVGNYAKDVIAKGTVIRRSMTADDRKAMVAVRDIPPFRLLTQDDVAQPPARTFSVVSIPARSVIQPSQVVTIDAQFNAIVSIKMPIVPPLTTPGSLITLIVTVQANAPGHRVSAEVLRSTAIGEGAIMVLALPSADEIAVMTAHDVRALQEEDSHVARSEGHS